MKKYKVVPTEKQLATIKQHWKKLQEIESEFHEKLMGLEISMEAATGIKGIEFFSCDGGYVGVGNTERTMELVHLNM
jgi:hypothetical protein